ncbi:type 4a pilus biogenesis protein PilO [Paenibacillus sp. B2(2019)]|uniref:type 4a pilus biogenesis protein PilO n=1 Tax=Paenibacillus sp. B2(2019) TaxID=2607754 RepID=UPI0011F16244|nr:type 4a pilus biogenesis protein PilO [Paenibacillus sp. B2(2019)]KAA1186868.1 type 4a pilus biogenesis protein PilO [Paenibacillus sp. B2(2019)]
MEQFNKYRSPIVLGVLILFLMLFAFYMLGVQPTNKEISAQNAEIRQLEKEAEILQTKINELKSSTTSLDSEQQELLAALPKGDDSEGLIDDLRAVGMSSQARLKDVSFILDEANPIQQMTGSAEVLFPTIKQIKMTAVVEGTYTSIRQWMEELQTLARIVNVDSFNFQQSYEERSKDSPESILTANVAFTAYYEVATPSSN